MPSWLREILVSLGIAARAVFVFAVAVAFGILVSLKVGDENPWIGAAAAIGLLLVIVLPFRLWWVGRSRKPDDSA
jgi:uncharacterized membrane protein YqjE